MILTILISLVGCGNQTTQERSTEKREITIKRQAGKTYLDDELCNNLVSQLNDKTIKKGEELDLSNLLNSYLTEYSVCSIFRRHFNNILEDKYNSSNTIHAKYDVTFNVSYTEDEITITYYKINHAIGLAP